MMTKEELINRLEKELQKEQMMFPYAYQQGYADGWIEATQRIFALLKEVK
jgi:hypothetical protein